MTVRNSLQLRCRADGWLALAGAELGATLDGQLLNPWQPFRMYPGQRLCFSTPKRAAAPAPSRELLSPRRRGQGSCRPIPRVASVGGLEHVVEQVISIGEDPGRVGLADRAGVQGVAHFEAAAPAWAEACAIRLAAEVVAEQGGKGRVVPRSVIAIH
ncbi:hypothetical protein ACK1U3_23915 [Pseudomonas promysalinigenes]|uniref:hypothetical protein n=1 Tax=Pseudomonas promysalinigenes TaxID=485898 RepID=UPI00391713A6